MSIRGRAGSLPWSGVKRLAPWSLALLFAAGPAQAQPPSPQAGPGHAPEGPTGDSATGSRSTGNRAAGSDQAAGSIQPGAAGQDAAGHVGNGEEPAEETAETILRRAAAIDALIAGELDPGIAPSSLLTLDLRSLDGTEALLAAVAATDPDAPATAPGSTDGAGARPAGTPDELALARAELEAARRRYLALGPEGRQAVLETHAERQRASAAARQAAAAQRARLTAVEAQVGALEAFLAGDLDVAIEPSALLLVDLTDPDEVADSDARRARLVAGAAEGSAPAGSPGAAAGEPAGDGTDLDRQVAQAAYRLDALRLSFVAMPASERAALFAQHAQRQREAELAASTTAGDRQAGITEAEREAQAAAAERAAAVAASQNARTEALRTLAEEQARLLGVKEAQVRFEAGLLEQSAALEGHVETALGWSRRVREIADRSVLDRARERDADRTYGELVGALTTMRSQLDDALSALGSGNGDIPAPGDGIDLPEQLDTGEVDRIRDAVTEKHGALVERQDEVRVAVATALRDAIVTMNESRIELMPYLSARKAAALEGLGADGVRQAGREIEQMTLETRFHVVNIPRLLLHKLDDVTTSPVPLLFGLIKLGIMILAFRWWRRRADGILTNLQESLVARRPENFTTRGGALATWYALRIRKPVEWLILAWGITGILIDIEGFPETKYLWLIAQWVLIGGIIIHFLDALAARQSGRQDETASLRFRSLRMVGIIVIVVGLVLSLTEISVGRGTIYGWASSLAWMLILPVAIILLVWWRPTVFTRVGAKAQPGPILSWVNNHQSGAASYPAAALGGLMLFADGTYRYAWRQASQLAVTRQLLSYLFRKEVEKQAAATAADREYEPLDAAVRTRLSPPHPMTETADMVDAALGKVTAVKDAVEQEGSDVVAVIGERGLGKTTFLTRLAAGLDPAIVCRVTCTTEGIDGLVADLSRFVGLEPTVGDRELAKKLREHSPLAILIDDGQRLVEPLIGGLRGIDRLANLARRAGGGTSWIVTMAAPAWQYLHRARGERMLFEEVVELTPWSDAQIAELVRKRASAAGIKPRYDALVVPRQVELNHASEENQTEKDYARILNDYSRGNPLVAMHYFAESLGTFENELYVRLFKTPPTSELEGLPSTMYFVLRAILQLEVATEEQIVACTDLQGADVSAALRSCRTRGFVLRHDRRLHISLHWYRAITQVLQRQHLIQL